MRALLAVVERELGERRTVFAAALVAGLAALATPLLPWLARGGAREQTGVMALTLASAFAVGLALTYGASMIGRDLRERRLGFYLARPIPAWSLWFGKLAAGLLLVLGGGFLVLLPAVVAGAIPGALIPRDRVPLLAALVAAGALSLLVLAHAATVAVRSRSRLVVLDVALLFATAGAVTAVSRRLAGESASAGLLRGLSAYGLLTLAALVAAGWAQVAAGRSDPRRGHGALSLTLWGIVGVSTALLAGYGWWFLAVSPRSLEGVFGVAAAPCGPWMVVSGRARGRGDYEPAFLLDATTGRSVRLAGSVTGLTKVAFSGDGTRAAWLVATGGRGSPAEVRTLDLAAPAARPVATTISFPMQGAFGLTLSADGGRIAVREGPSLSVYDLATGRRLVSVRLPGAVAVARAWFVSADRLRLLGFSDPRGRVERGDLAILELDVPEKRLRETGRIPDVARSALFFVRDGGGATLLLRDTCEGSTTFALVNAVTGSTVAALAACDRDTACQATTLADGRIVVGEAGATGARLRVFSPAGEAERVLELPAARTIRLGLEPVAGSVAVALAPDRLADWAAYTTLIVDIAHGSRTALGRAYRPAGWYWWVSDWRFAAGGTAARAFLAQDGSLVLLDPSANGFRTVLPAG